MAEYLMYLRKSRQDDPNESVEEVLRKHEIILQEYALKNFGYRIPEKDIYREVVSGETIDSRVEIKKMFSRLETENILGTLCVEPQRLTRGELMDMAIVVQNFLYTNTKVCTPMHTYDLSNKYDRKMFEMELQRGSDYLDYTKEILARGREASKRRGNFIHNVPPYGYDRIKINKDWTLIPNESQAHYVRLAFEMYAEGIGAYTIAKKLEELGAKPMKGEYFTEGVIRQILRNPTYIGKIKVGERKTEKILENGQVKKKRIRIKDYEIVDGKHEPLITQELYDKVQERFGSISRETPKKELKNMWAGLIKCKRCGYAVERALGSNKKAHRIRCRNARNCDNKSHVFDDIHNAIVNQLKLELEDFSVKVKANTTGEANEREKLIKSLKTQLDVEKKKQEKLYEFLENGIYSVDVFVARNNKAKEEIERLEKAIKKVENEIPMIKEAQDFITSFHQTLDMLDDESISIKIKNNFLKKIVKVIYYEKTDDGITLDVHLHM